MSAGLDGKGLGVPERRRAPRAVLADRSWLTAPSSWPVQLMDVSLGGVAFTSPHGLEVGRTLAARATLGRGAFNGQIRICWSRPRAAGTTGSQFDVGAVFLPLDESSRRALETFLKLPTPQ